MGINAGLGPSTMRGLNAGERASEGLPVYPYIWRSPYQCWTSRLSWHGSACRGCFHAAVVGRHGGFAVNQCPLDDHDEALQEGPNHLGTSGWSTPSKVRRSPQPERATKKASLMVKGTGERWLVPNLNTGRVACIPSEQP
jgi:hypothetical protein